MIITIALVSAAVTCLVEVAKLVVKKTKNKTDDKVVEFLADNADAVVDYIVKTRGVPPPAPRPKTVDHRTSKSEGK